MKRVVEFWIKSIRTQPVLIFSIIAGLLFFGIWIAWESEIEAFPDLTNVQVQVITPFQGKAAEEVERLVTVPLEVATTGLPGLINQRSISIFGLSVITLTFDDNVIGRQARLDVSQRLGDADLPEGIKPGLSPDSTPVGEVFRFIVKGDKSPGELRLIEDWIVERNIKNIPGVADVVSFGGPQQTIDIKIDPSKLKAFGLSFDTVAQNIGQNHINAGGGMLNHGEENYLVRSIGMLGQIKDIESAVVATNKNTPIRIRDMGRVIIGNKLRLGQVGINQVDDAIEGIVLLRQGADTLETCGNIRKKISELNSDILPAGIKIEPYYDRTDLIVRSGQTVIHNILFGIFLVCLILLIGLGWRYWMMTLAVALVIPFALICAFVGIKILGYKPNLISLGAVDFGIIVETAIFAAEAVIMNYAYRLSANNRKLADVLAEVLAPSLLCAVLLMIAFIPILSLQRVEGRIFKPLGITLVSALIGGQIGTFIFIPLFAQMCPSIENHSDLVEKYLLSLYDKCVFFGKKIALVSRLPWLIGIILLSLIFLFYSITGQEFLPQLNEGSLYIRATAPPTISREAASTLAGRIRLLLAEIPEVENVVSQIGRPDDGTDVNGFYNIENFVSLKEPQLWKSATTIDGLTKIAQSKLSPIEGVEFNFSQPIKDNVDEAISGVKGELVVKIFGPDINQLQILALKVKNILSQISGAEDVGAEELKAQPELRFKMLHEQLARFGIRVVDAESTLESALNGKLAGKLTDESGRQISIMVKADLPEHPEKLSLQALSVVGADGSRVALSEVANISLVEGVSRIYREDGSRRIAIKCSVRNRAVVDFVKEASSKLKTQIQLPEHYHLQWSGSFENANRAGRQLSFVIPLCILAMVIVLYSWFKNWTLVGNILWEVPFSLVGSLIFLKIFHLNLSISAAAGIIVVIGVSFLTGIMLISESIHRQCVWLGLKVKLRSIIISSLVAIIGLIPAAFSNGIGSETAKPFAVSILGGLVTSLILTILILPALMEDYFKVESSKL